MFSPGALADVSPATRERRRWVHKTANVLVALPKRLHGRAKAALAEISQAETRSDAEVAIAEFSAKYPKGRRQDPQGPGPAAGVLRLPRRPLSAPTNHEPDRVGVRHRPVAYPGHQRRGETTTRTVMAYKLLDAAQDGWRRINSPELVPLVRAGIEFKDGIMNERKEDNRDAA